MLTVSVTRGDLIAKSNVRKKLHPSYETTLRIVKEDANSILDMEDPKALHRITRTFDGYRNVFNDLKEIGVVSEVEFPKSYTKSTLGVSLSEQELQQRCAELNDWIEDTISNYSRYSIAAQTIILQFLTFKLDTTQKKVLNSAEDDEDDFAVDGKDTVIDDSLKERMMKILSNGKVLKSAVLIRRAFKAMSISPEITFTDSSNKKTSQNMHPLTAYVSQNNKESSDRPKPGKGSDSEDEFDDEKFSSNVNGNGYAAVKSGEFSLGDMASGNYHSAMSQRGTSIAGSEFNTGNFSIEPCVIREHLQIAVQRGMMQSKGDGPKKHPTYLTTLHVVGSARRYQPCMRQTFFEGYRNLASKLFDLGVSDDPKSAFVIASPFPSTHTRSKFGFQLSESLLNKRCWYLHHWMVALLSIYPTIPSEARDIINDFFDLDEDNPSEPQNKAILAILDDKWVSMDKQEKEAFRQLILAPEAVKLEKDSEFLDIDNNNKKPNGCCIVM